MQSTPQAPPNQLQHTQSALPPMPSLVNSLLPQQQQPQQQLPPQQPIQPLKINSSLSQPQQNMVQNQNALNNNDVNQSFSTPLNTNVNLSNLLGICLTVCKI